MSAGGNGILVGYGAYAFFQVWVVGGSAGCTVTANYVGTSVSPQNTVGAADQTAYAKLVLNDFVASGNQTVIGTVTPYGNTSGIIILSSLLNGGPPAGSSIQVKVPASGFGPDTIANFTIWIPPAIRRFLWCRRCPRPTSP